jgi:hypothetical protein
LRQLVQFRRLFFEIRINPRWSVFNRFHRATSGAWHSMPISLANLNRLPADRIQFTMKDFRGFRRIIT